MLKKSLKELIAKDPIGAAIKDYWENGTAPLIDVVINNERDDPMPPSIFFRNFQHMKGYERMALKMCKGSVLDVGAAAGCHSLILQKRNLDVTALEKSKWACEVMTARGVKRILNENIFNLKGIEYNTILLLMNGLGMGGDEKGTLKLLKHLKKLLAPKGMIIGDSTDILYSTMKAEEVFEEGENYYGQVEFKLSYKKVKGEPFNWIYLDPALLADLADKAGLTCNIIYRDDNFHYLAKLTKA